MAVAAKDHADDLLFLNLHRDLLQPGVADRSVALLAGARAVWEGTPLPLKVVAVLLSLLGFFIVAPFVCIAIYRMMQSRVALTKCLLLLLLGGLVLIGTVFVAP